MMVIEIIWGMIAAVVGLVILVLLAVGASAINRLLLEGSYWINSGLALCLIIGFYTLLELLNVWDFDLAEQLFGVFIVVMFAWAILLARDVRQRTPHDGETTSQPQSGEES